VKAKWQVGGAFAIGQDAEVPDAHEPFGKQMQLEAAQGLIERSYEFLFVVVSGNLEARLLGGDLAPAQRDLPQTTGGWGIVIGACRRWWVGIREGPQAIARTSRRVAGTTVLVAPVVPRASLETEVRRAENAPTAFLFA
jgi:hypothetical protein